MSLLPVSALKDQKPIIHSLLSIFQQGKLEDFQSFIKTNPSACSDYNSSEEEAIRHMRLLSLCSLATEHEEIPYDAIAATLQVDESEVEGWVIAAVSSGLVSAKMDQLQHVVMVERCVVRKFGIEQWKILQTRLDAWKTNVKTVLDGLKQSQAGLA
jgi:translation initiation factor 3 subunit M